MTVSLKYFLRKEVDDKLFKFRRYCQSMKLKQSRLEKLSLDSQDIKIKFPQHWKKNKLFNPFYLKKIKKFNRVYRALKIKLANGSYKCKEPKIIEIPKKSGGIREVSVFEIPDAAVSDYLFFNLSCRNNHLFSSSVYSYRFDRGVLEAIERLSSIIKRYSSDEIYLAEYDLSKFFDNIKHDFIFHCMNKFSIQITKEEISVIKSFFEAYANANNSTPNIGIPQGLSISLFLANVCGMYLDNIFESLGVSFVRYCDDFVVLTNDIDKISKINKHIEDFQERSGVSINEKKSPGIRCLSRRPHGSLKSTVSFEFLGYCVTRSQCLIPNDKINSLKSKLVKMMYMRMLYPIMTSGSLRDNFINISRRMVMREIGIFLGTEVNQPARKIKIDSIHYSSQSLRKGLNLMNAVTGGKVLPFYISASVEQLKEIDEFIKCKFQMFKKIQDRKLRDYGLVAGKNYKFTNTTCSKHNYLIKKKNGNRNFIVNTLSDLLLKAY